MPSAESVERARDGVLASVTVVALASSDDPKALYADACHHWRQIDVGVCGSPRELAAAFDGEARWLRAAALALAWHGHRGADGIGLLAWTWRATAGRLGHVQHAARLTDHLLPLLRARSARLAGESAYAAQCTLLERWCAQRCADP